MARIKTDRKSESSLTNKQIRIIEAALEIFLGKGHFETSFIEISNKVGSAPGTVKGHFKSKEDLYDQIFNFCNNQLLTHVQKKVRKTGNISQVLENIWIERARWGLEHPTQMRYIYSRIALDTNNLFEYQDKLLKSYLLSGIKNRILIGYQNANYLICLFYTFNNSIIISMIGKRYGDKQKIMIIKKAFNIFFGMIKRENNLALEEVIVEFASQEDYDILL